MIINPENNQTELIKNSLKIKASRLFVAAKMIMRTILINGPIYGMIFKTAQIKAIASEFSTPKINNNKK